MNISSGAENNHVLCVDGIHLLIPLIYGQSEPQAMWIRNGMSFQCVGIATWSGDEVVTLSYESILSF